MIATADTKEKVFNYVLQNKVYEDILAKFFPYKPKRNEFKSLLWLQICEMDEKKIIDAWNYNYFIYLYTAIIKNQVKSSNSYWFKERGTKYVEFFDSNVQEESDIEDKELIERKLDIVEDALSSLASNPNNFVEIELFKLYFYKNLTYREISKKTKIPLKSVYDYVQRALVLTKGFIKKKYGTEFNY